MHLRPTSLLRSSLLRSVDSKFLGDSLGVWEFHPSDLILCLSQTLWSPESLFGDQPWYRSGSCRCAMNHRCAVVSQKAQPIQHLLKQCFWQTKHPRPSMLKLTPAMAHLRWYTCNCLNQFKRGDSYPGALPCRFAWEFSEFSTLDLYQLSGDLFHDVFLKRLAWQQ